jgi:DNA-binding CsgD family transcriptional regulator
MNVLQEVQKILGGVGADEKSRDTTAIAAQKKLLDIFHVGNYYHYLVNVRRSRLEYTGPKIKGAQRYKEPMERMGNLVKLIHPDDMSYYLSFEAAIDRFLDTLSDSELFKYKIQYDFRTRKADGSYVRTLHQFVLIHHDEQDIRKFAVDTDITHIKSAGKPQLSFIGLDDSVPSYYTVDAEKVFIGEKPFFTLRQQDILRELLEGKSSLEISKNLNISKYTVDVHRKNMIRKTGVKSTDEILQLASKNGWI